jgi:O-antigen ligase
MQKQDNSNQINFILLVGLYLTTLGVWPLSNDSFIMIKSLCAVAVAFFLTVYFFSNLSRIFKDAKIATSILISLLLIFSFNLFTTSGNIDEKIFGSFARNNGFLFYVSLCIVFFSAYIFGSKTLIVKIIHSLNVITICLIIINFIQIFKINISFLNPNNSVIGLFGNSNYISAYLGIVSSIFIYQAFKVNNILKLRIFNCLILICIVYQIFTSNSIQGFLYLVISIFLYVFIKIRQRIKFLADIMLTLTVFATTVVWSRVFGSSFSNLLSNDLSTKERLSCARGSWNMFLNQPITGVGFGQIDENYYRYRTLESQQIFGLNANCDSSHNFFLDIFSQTGLLTLLFSITFLIFFIKKIIDFTYRSLEIDDFQLLVFIISINFIIQCFINIPTVSIQYMGWMIIGLFLSKQTFFSKNSGLKTFKKLSILQVLVSTLIIAIITMPTFIKQTRFYLAYQKNSTVEMSSIALSRPDNIAFIVAATKISFAANDLKQADRLIEYAKIRFSNSPDTFYLILENPGSSAIEKNRARQNLYTSKTLVK